MRALRYKDKHTSCFISMREAWGASVFLLALNPTYKPQGQKAGLALQMQAQIVLHFHALGLGGCGLLYLVSARKATP